MFPIEKFRENLRLEDLLRPPWLLGVECRPRLLVVTDSLNFRASDGFGLSEFVQALRALLDEMQTTLAALNGAQGVVIQIRDASIDAVMRLRKSTDAVLAALSTSPDRAMAVSVPFLKLCALTMGGWFMARAAAIAAQRLAEGSRDREFLEGKLATAHFYATQLLPQVLALEHIVAHGSDAVVGTDASLI